MTNSEHPNRQAPTDRSPLSTFTVADLSTRHVTPADMEGLSAAESVIAYVDEYGAWVWVPSDDLENQLGDMRTDGMSDLFIDVLRAAKREGCAYVRLDADGPVSDDLPTSDAW